MKQRNAMCPADSCELPAIASPNIGLASLSFKPRMPNRWDDSNGQPQYQPLNPWSTRYIQHLSNLKYIQQLPDLKINRSSKVDHDVIRRGSSLPKDPRQWSREDVATWVQLVVSAHSLPSVHLDRFLMNGKALCLMTIDMFVKRVPLGGKLLYKDFQLRLSSALYS